MLKRWNFLKTGFYEGIIIGLLFAFIPVVGAFIAFPCIGVGLPLAIIALVKGRRRKQGTGFAIAGVACNTVALFIAIIWLVVVGAAVSELESEIESDIFTIPGLGGSIDRSVKNNVGMMGPRPTDAEIRSACTALRNAGWSYLDTSLQTSNRSLVIAAAITTYASGDALREYCNSK